MKNRTIAWIIIAASMLCIGTSPFWLRPQQATADTEAPRAKTAAAPDQVTAALDRNTDAFVRAFSEMNGRIDDLVARVEALEERPDQLADARPAPPPKPPVPPTPPTPPVVEEKAAATSYAYCRTCGAYQTWTYRDGRWRCPAEGTLKKKAQPRQVLQARRPMLTGALGGRFAPLKRIKRGLGKLGGLFRRR